MKLRQLRPLEKRKKDMLPLSTEMLDWKHQFPEMEKRESPVLRPWITRIPLLRSFIRRKEIGRGAIDWDNPFPITVTVGYRHRHSTPTLKEAFAELDVGVFSHNSYKAVTSTIKRINGSKRGDVEDIKFSFSLTNHGSGVSPGGLSVRFRQKGKPHSGDNPNNT